MNVESTLKTIKSEFEHAIQTATFNGVKYQNGNKAKEALIRSQRIINHIHECVKKAFISEGIKTDMIFPPLGRSGPEISLTGFLKSKSQDVAIIPSRDIFKNINTAKNNEAERIMTVNIRSQLSSLSKNIDTLYERTFAEALNLHLSYPKQCLGEVYLIPTCEYDDKAMLRNKVVFKNNSRIDNYIRMFQAINNRKSVEKDAYKYERVCLLIVDFNKESPKLYNSISELKSDGLISKESLLTLDNLTTTNFANDLIDIYSRRFGSAILR